MVRVKMRYLLCEITVSDRSKLLLLNDRAIMSAVRATVERVHGDYGAAMCTISFCVKYLNAYTGIVFLRFSKNSYKLLWSALPFITSIESHGQKVSCFLSCLHVGGTIRTCQKFLVQYNRRQLHRMLPKCKNDEEKLQLRKSLLTCSLLGGTKRVFEEEEESGDDED